MPVIKISAFAGEKPLITPRLLPETAATAASNVKLNDGALTPTNKAALTGGNAGAANDKTIFRHGDTWLSWASHVHAVPGPVADDRLYYTGDGAPKMRVAGAVYPLALNKPASALTATLGGSGTGDTQSRTYVYTHVTDFGEESAPSPASAIVDWKPGQTVTLSGFGAIPTGRAISKQRIYRSQTGSSGTYFYLIAERAASTGDFIDNISVDTFQEPLPSADWNAPPATLSGLTSLPNGMMAAFSGRDVYFCEPWRPHAWPEKYIVACDSDIVGLAAIGSSLVVMTKAHPYLMSGSSPDSMVSTKLEANFPCINARGIADLGFAICFPSHEGLVAVRADGSVGLATLELFDRSDWLTLAPTSFVAAQYGGAYVLFYDTTNANGDRETGSIFININAAQYLVRSSEMADAAWYSVADAALYFKRPGKTEIMRFDAPGAAPEKVHWRSKEFWITQPVNFGAVLIDLGLGLSARTEANIRAEREAIDAQNAILFSGPSLESSVNEREVNALPVNGDLLIPYPYYEGVLLNVYADGQLIRSVSRAGTIERLPGKQKARCWELEISASVQVTQIVMAGTVDELRGAV